jgi:hypothetical protein
MQHLMELKNVSLLGFYALMRNWPRVPKRFGMPLSTGHKMTIETRIKEISSPLDSRHSISAREPLTLGFHALEVALVIDFEN